MRLLFLAAILLSPLARAGEPADARQQRRQQLEREAEAQRRALEKHDREDEEAFEREVRAHPDDAKLQQEWQLREAREKGEQEERKLGKHSGPLDPRTPEERGDNGVVLLGFTGPSGEEWCSGVLVGATASTALVLTRARCVADFEHPAAPRMRKLEMRFNGDGAPAGVLTQKIFPGYLEARARGEDPRDGSDVALVIASAPVPPDSTLLMILQEPEAALRALAKKPLQVVGFGKRGGGRRAQVAGRVADVERYCAVKPCEGRTNALVLAASGDCGDADAGGATTIFYPPSVFLIGLNAAEPGKRGACVSHPLSGLGSGPLRWVAKNALSNDFKTCVREARTARVTCRDSRAMGQ